MAIESNPIYQVLDAISKREMTHKDALKKKDSRAFQSSLLKSHFAEMIEHVKVVMQQNLNLADTYIVFTSLCAKKDKIGDNLFDEINDTGRTIAKKMNEPHERMLTQSTTKEKYEETTKLFGIHPEQNGQFLESGIKTHGSIDKYLEYLRQQETILESRTSYTDLAYLKSEIADVYRLIGDSKTAVEVYRDAAAHFSGEQHQQNKAYCYVKEALSYAACNVLNEAKHCFVSAKCIFETLNMGTDSLLCTIQMGRYTLTENRDPWFFEEIFSAKEMFERSNMPLIVAECNLIIGKLYALSNKNGESNTYFQEAKQIYIRENKERDAIGCDVELANEYAVAGNHSKACEILESAKKQYAMLQEIPLAANCDRMLGGVHRRKGSVLRAAYHYEASKKAHERLNNMREKGYCLQELANCYEILNESDKAIASLKEAERIFGDLGMEYERAECKIRKSDVVCKDLKYVSKELALAFKKRQELNENVRERTAKAEMEIGKCYLAHDYIVNGIDHLKVALNEYRACKVAEQALECETLIREAENKTFLHVRQVHELATFEMEAKRLETHREICCGGRSKTDIAECDMELGELYEEHCSYGKALVYYQEARDIYRETNNRKKGALCLARIGEMYSNLGQLDKANESCSVAKEMFREQGNVKYATLCDAMIAGNLREMGNPSEALIIYDRILKVVTGKKTANTFIAACGHNMGLVYSDMGENEKARTLFLAGLQAAEEMCDGYSEGIISINIAKLDRAQGKIEEALKGFKEAYDNHKDVADLKIRSLFEMGKTLELLGREDEGLRFLQEAVNEVEHLRTFIPQGANKTSFLESVYDTYKVIIDIYLKKRAFEKALEYVERLKSRNLVEMLRVKRVELKCGGKEELEELNALRMKMHSKMARPDGNDNFVIRQVRIERVRKQYEDLATKIGQREVTEAKDEAKTITYEEMQALADKRGCAIIELFPRNSDTVVFTIIANQPLENSSMFVSDYNRNRLREQMKELSDRYVKIQESKTYPERERNKRVWESYLEAILEELYSKIYRRLTPDVRNISNLVLIPFGEFHLLPLHAMFREERGKRIYLIDEHVVTYAPSAAVFKECSEEKRERIDKVLVTVSDGDGGRRLPFVQSEAKQIGRMFSECKIILNPKESEILKEGKNCDVLHFAGHAEFGKIVLESKDGEMAKEVSMEDIYAKWELPKMWLVTLSACETGRVQIGKNIDEYIGLPSSLLHAGAATVVSSLWSIEDYATSLLMGMMYKLLKEGRGKGEALIEAQRWLKDPRNRREHINEMGFVGGGGNEEWLGDLSRPYYWAGFSCTGAY